jgi:hypothetical protein
MRKVGNFSTEENNVQEARTRANICFSISYSMVIMIFLYLLLLAYLSILLIVAIKII